MSTYMAKYLGNRLDIAKEDKGVVHVDSLVSGHKYYMNYGAIKRIEEQLGRQCRYYRPLLQ